MYSSPREFNTYTPGATPVHSPDEQRTELFGIAAKSAAVAAGVVIAVEMYRHRKLLAVAGAFTAALIWTNRQVKNLPPARRTYRTISGSPSFHGDAYSPATQTPMDEVEEAAMESFPASDPPASHQRA